MGDSIADREHIVAYLLGELPPEEQLRLEQDYFTDDAAYEQILVVEDELAYDYVRNLLPPERRVRFEATIGASDRGRQNLEFARTLLDALQTTRTPAAPTARYWIPGIAAALLLAAISVWLAFRVAHLSSETEQLRASAAATEARLQQKIAVLERAPVETAFLLAPGRTRDAEGTARLEIAPETAIVRFELVLPPGAAPGDYVVTLRTTAGGEIWSHSAAVTGRTAAAAVPAKLLGAGDYEIGLRRLTAGEQAPQLAAYFFHLHRK